MGGLASRGVPLVVIEVTEVRIDEERRHARRLRSILRRVLGMTPTTRDAGHRVHSFLASSRNDREPASTTHFPGRVAVDRV